jgi:two-component system sensor kinase FixL
MGHLDPPGRAAERATDPPGSALGEAMSQVVRFLRRRRGDAAGTPMRITLEDLRALLDAAPTSLLLVDDKDRVVAANLCAERLLGHPVNGLAGVRIDDVLPPCLRAGEQLVIRPDGSQSPIGVEPRPVRLGGDDYQLVALSDVAERPRQEREATRQRDELAHLTRAAMLGELSGALAHELNQPLSAILTNAQTAQRLLRARPARAPDPVLDDILADIVADDRRAGEVIQRLRKWLRKEHAEFVSLAVNEIVLDALHLIRSELLHRGVDVHVELAGDLPMVDGDRILLQQVLLNFVINGCDAMKGLPLPRLLRVRAFEANGGIRVEVIDHGRGIPPPILSVMFEPFETTKPDGMGMGLAVCRTIVESHRGHVFARNVAEGGACVGFELPARTP